MKRQNESITRRVSLSILPSLQFSYLRRTAPKFCESDAYDPDMMADILRAISRMERCSLEPSTSLLSTSENTMTILFFCLSGMVSSYTIAW